MADQEPVQEDLTASNGHATANSQSKPPSNTPSASGVLQRCTDTALDFLAHASNETLGACLVGLGATTYFVLGRVGLVIIGVAGGVVLHASWEGVRQDDRSDEVKAKEQEIRRQAGIEVVRRALQWRKSKDDESEDNSMDSKMLANTDLDYSGFDPLTEKALNTFTEAVITDYVRYWYSPTVPDEESFPRQCRRVLTAFVLSMSAHLQRKRPADAFLDFVTNASSIIVVFLNELSVALNASSNTPAADAVKTYLENKPDSNLASLLDSKYQNRKLAIVSEDILEAYLDPKSINCPPVHTFLKEILAQLVLGYTITLCSAPDWINDYIIYGLEESQTTKDVMDIVDAGVEGKVTPTIDNASVSAEEPSRTSLADDEASASQHKREMSQADDAMDEAMKEARRLTQLMIEEDERRRQDDGKSIANSTEDISEGIVTPPSSESDHGRHGARSSVAMSESSTAWTSDPTESTLPRTPTSQQFTSFDQLLPDSRPTALSTSPEVKKDAPVLTLHNANISIFDDSMPGEKASIKAKPTTDYLIQIEPASGAFAGWMIARKYADFEMLHEVLRRISVITGSKFTETHTELPKWKLNTKANLRQDLERYLMDAVRFQPLAESEGMKRFLEKDQQLLKGPNKGFGWPTPEAFGKLGGDVINVLAKAPKDVAGGGKALFGGLKGKKNQPQASRSNTGLAGTPGEERKSMQFANAQAAVEASVKHSSESASSPVIHDVDTDSLTPSKASTDHDAGTASLDIPARTDSLASQTQPPAADVPVDPVAGITDTFELPPPPSEMPDDYDGGDSVMEKSVDALNSADSTTTKPRSKKVPSKKPPITEQETSVAIELMFAVITELYTLSSAWQFRRTLLAAAKSFLLRPGNPQLIAIKDLLQKDLLDANLSDEGIAAQVYKLRENALPTAEEMDIWRRDYPEKTPEQKEEARIKARKLLVTKGMPSALTSVMGAAASGEALGRVFDCLQVPEISRGLVFGLMLQALKVVTH